MTYTYNYSDTGFFGEMFAAIMAVLGIVLLITFAVAVLVIIAQAKVLKKADKPGWGAIIPVYNVYLLCEIAGVNPWWILIVFLSPILGIVPILGSLASMAVSIYFTILLHVSIAKAFDKDSGFAVGLILLPVVFYPILGFSKDITYTGKKPMKDLLFDNINQNNPNNSQSTEKNVKYCSACGAQVPMDTKYCPKCGKEL